MHPLIIEALKKAKAQAQPISSVEERRKQKLREQYHDSYRRRIARIARVLAIEEADLPKQYEKDLKYLHRKIDRAQSAILISKKNKEQATTARALDKHDTNIAYWESVLAEAKQELENRIQGHAEDLQHLKDEREKLRLEAKEEDQYVARMLGE